MKTSTSKLAVILSSLVATGAFAQAKAPQPDWSVSYNLGAVTDYRYRGISQSAVEPALQGGADLVHKDGFYIGTWASSIRWLKDSSANPTISKGPVEIDIYGGYKGELSPGLGFDVGALQYWYANNNIKKLGGTEPNTLELYGALSYGPFTAKYSHSTSNLFGTANSKGSEYIDLSATFGIGKGLSLVAHVGNQRIKNLTSYTDYSLGLTQEVGSWVFSATAVGTNWRSKTGSAYTLPGTGTKDLAGSGLVLGAKKNF